MRDTSPEAAKRNDGTNFEPRFHVDERPTEAWLAEKDETPERFVFIENVRAVWHDTYEIEASAPLTDGQVDRVRSIFYESFDSCGCDRGDQCVGVRGSWESGGRFIGAGLTGDADQYQTFEPFFLSKSRAICQDCAWEICQIDEDSFNDETSWTVAEKA